MWPMDTFIKYNQNELLEKWNRKPDDIHSISPRFLFFMIGNSRCILPSNCSKRCSGLPSECLYLPGSGELSADMAWNSPSCGDKASYLKACFPPCAARVSFSASLRPASPGPLILFPWSSKGPGWPGSPGRWVQDRGGAGGDAAASCCGWVVPLLRMRSCPSSSLQIFSWNPKQSKDIAHGK